MSDHLYGTISGLHIYEPLNQNKAECWKRFGDFYEHEDHWFASGVLSVARGYAIWSRQVFPMGKATVHMAELVVAHCEI